MAESSSVRAIKPSDLPAPPQAAIRIMRACSREEVSIRELSSLAKNDPVLSAELLRVVNSPFYGLARQVQSIPHAVSLLGQRVLHNMALCISVRDALRQDTIPGFDATAYWEDSLRRAVSARLLGGTQGLNLDECFTAGLLQDFGLLVMFFTYKDKAPLWSKFREQAPDVRYGMERDTFNTTHDMVVMMLAQAWELPEELAHALSFHHRPADEANEATPTRLCRVLYCADWMAAVYTASDKSSVLDRCRWVLSDVLALDAQRIEECLTAIPEQVEEAAAALGLRLDQQEDFNDVLRQANLRLTEENQSKHCGSVIGWPRN
jgi:HD-like signal output (HDOD) protein